MAYNCVALIKQVPDTKRITGQAMNDDGTVNRSALPAIFNPEDLNALESALQIKDKFGGKVTVVTMGLPAAAAVLRDSLFRGADDAILITDQRCAASDTLATSYILSCAVKKIIDSCFPPPLYERGGGVNQLMINDSKEEHKYRISYHCARRNFSMNLGSHVMICGMSGICREC